MFKIILCLISYASYLIPSFSQDANLSNTVKFSRIGSDQDLSQASVNCILQDSKGYMWFGTQDGLNKFNGYEMAVYKHDPSDTNSLSNNWIDCLYEDREGIIWAGTRGGGLNAYNPFINRFTRFENDPKNESSISSNQIKCILEDKSGIYWVGTTSGLNSFNGKTNVFEKYIQKTDDTLSINGSKVETVYEDAKSRLWVGTFDGGLNLLNKRKKTFIRCTDLSGGKGNEYYNRVQAIMEDKTGIFWIATDNGGVVSFDPEKKKFLQRILHNPDRQQNNISENRVSALCFDSKGALWIGTKSSGISYMKGHAGAAVNYRYNEYDSQSLSNDGINCVYKDREGNIWIGTEGGGVSVHFPSAARFKHFHKDIVNQDAFRSNTVFGLMQDKDGLIWVGTMYGGITTIDREKNIYVNLSSGTKGSLVTSRSNSVLSLFEDTDGLIWVGTWGGGLNTYDKKTGKINHIMETGAITCLSQGNGDLIWGGVYGRGKGVFAYNKSSSSITNFTINENLSSNDIYCIYENKNRIVWIGTAGGGLNKLDYKTGKVEVYKHEKGKNSISDNTVNCLWDDLKGNLWIGTSNGLNKFDIKSKSFIQYNEKDGLPNGNIWGILGDKRGNLWISTNKGISRFNPSVENKEGIAFKNFTTHDGLQGDEFAQGSYFLNRQTGEMFFGGLNGFNAFYPDHVTDNKHIPPVFITSFKKFGKEAELDTSISNKKYMKLSYKDNFISFEFVALDYIFPKKNKYSFRMDGLDNDWSPPSARRYVSYTNLPGGDYVFRVKGSNSDGVWNEEGVSIYLKVIPPWWKTSVFYAFSVIFLILLIVAFIHYRTAAIQKEKNVLEQKVTERTAELAQKNKDITSSIQYAKRIQQAILPTKEQVQKHFPESFILFNPKDIVSGDFYWFGEKNGRKISACVDCTGHGVPGAFMSMIGANLLNQIILENGITEPASILSALNQGVRAALKQGTQREIETTDGMDIALCSIDTDKREVQFSSALRHLIVISDNKLEKINGNKLSIGGAQVDTEINFTNHIKILKKGDILYMFSDGYADQFGGEKGKKLMVKTLYETLLSVNTLPMLEQRELLEKTLEDWKGKHSQVDDVLVIGIRL